MAYLGSIEYKPDASGTAELVKCPLVEDWIGPIDCMETQTTNAESIPERFKAKPDWQEICKSCPFRDY